MYSAFAVANAFIRLAPPCMTPMKLQKLLYVAQAWYLRERGCPLIDDHFSRWQYGPVIPSIHHKFKAYEAGVITQPAQTLGANRDDCDALIPAVPESDGDTWALLRVIAGKYGVFSAQQLAAMLMRQSSAWSDKAVPDGSVITHEQMRQDKALFEQTFDQAAKQVAPQS